MKKLIVSCALVASLAGCGNNSITDVLDSIAVAEYPLASAYSARVANGSSDNYTANISGICSGTAVISHSIPAAATFKGVIGFSVLESIVITLPTCTPSLTGINTTSYMDSNYTPLGYSVPSSIYGEVVNQTPFPATVRVGDSGVYATLNTWTDASKATVVGIATISYAVTKKDKTVANLTITTVTKNAANAVISTEIDVYTLDVNGTIVSVSVVIDGLNAVGATVHADFHKV